MDTKTGQIIAVGHKPSGLFMAYSEHQCAMKAVERTAKDMLKTLKDLASKNTSSGVISEPREKSEIKGQFL